MKGDPATPAPVLSEAPSPREDRVFGFFRQRISGVMASRGLPVERDTQRISDDPAVGTVVEAVGGIIADPSQVVAGSQVIAQRLFDTQDRRNSPGILVVSTGQIDGQACVGILKLEHERGVQAEEERDPQGNLVFRVILHDDLLLTERTAVFKCAVFRRRGQGLIAEASDLQNARELAGFFLLDFLGCRLVDDPPEATRKYFEAAESFINDRVGDPEKKARYEGALLAQMNSAVQTVDPDRFARDNLDRHEHQQFLDHLAEAGSNTTAFAKNTDRIKSRIKRVAYGFESGLKLVGNPEAMEDHVDIARSDTGTQVIISDEIKHMKGAA